MKSLSNFFRNSFQKSTLGVLFFLTLSQQVQAIKIGDPAPAVKGTNQVGKTIQFSDAYEKNKYVIVYFYPKANTPGCTAQANSLKESYEILKKRGAIVLGVSTDSIEAQKNFQDKYTLPFDLIADEKKSILDAFSVSSTLGFAKREAFLIQKGKIVWMDTSASTSEQASDVLKAIDSIEAKSSAAK